MLTDGIPPQGLHLSILSRDCALVEDSGRAVSGARRRHREPRVTHRLQVAADEIDPSLTKPSYYGAFTLT